jgi:hypothetical protein
MGIARQPSFLFKIIGSLPSARKIWSVSYYNFPMETPPSTQLTCTQCGGELHPDEGQIFLTCPFCNATVYLDKSRVVLHFSVTPTLDDQKAAGELRRWMSGSETVKDLDQKSQVTGYTFQFFPVWYFKWGQTEQITLQPAAATSVSELAKIPIPAGDLEPYTSAMDAQSQPPSVPLEAALDWFRQGNPSAEVKEMSLVHVPIYIFKYIFKGQTYTAVVDAANGTVMANIYPAKAEAPYLLVGIVAATVYLCLAVFPVAGGIMDNNSGVGTGVLLCGGIGLLAVPLFIAWGAWVAAKV